MNEILNDTDTIAESTWVMIKNHPELESSEIEKKICHLKHTTPATVRTLISQMVNSGIVIREKIDGKRTLKVNLSFPNKSLAIKYSSLYKKYDTYNNEKNIRFMFLLEELEKIDALRIELFLKTGIFYKHEQLFMYLFKHHENNILEKLKTQESIKTTTDESNVVLMSHPPVSEDGIPVKRIDSKEKDFSIFEIEKPTAMDKLLNFFKNMKFTYP